MCGSLGRPGPVFKAKVRRAESTASLVRVVFMVKMKCRKTVKDLRVTGNHLFKECKAIFVTVVKVVCGFFTKQPSPSEIWGNIKPLLTSHHLAETGDAVDSSTCVENVQGTLASYPKQVNPGGMPLIHIKVVRIAFNHP
jgi:hypothetical protein